MRFLVILAVVFPLLSVPCTGAELAGESGRTPLNIGIVPFFTPEKIWQLYSPFINYLNAKTPYLWQLKLGDKHDDLVRSLCAGDVSMAFLGPIPYAKALGQCAPRPVLVSLGTDGKPFYRSLIITADPSIKSISDLRGKKIALFEKSTAAYYLPLRMLAEEGITRDNLDIVLLSSQDKVIGAVLANVAAAGGVKDSLYASFSHSGLTVLKSSEPLPQFVFCSSPGLPSAVEKAFVEALLKLNPLTDAADQQLMSTWDREIASGFNLPPGDYRESTQKLLQSVQPFLK